MPLNKSGSKASVGQNIRTLKAEGKSQRQAVAIAMNVQREAKKVMHNAHKGDGKGGN